ncbi:MAG: FAD:protein FMN transferase [Myxococcales bacterium]|nr:FAD:protein FMN transferase [Myxococcales bacterium]MCB9522477.1 FAD:protein FMN transferase [Myxococcales bacterium]
MLPRLWLLGLLVGCPSLAVAAPGPPLASRDARRFTTEVKLTVVEAKVPATTLDAAFAAVLAEFDRLDALLSEWRPDTPIARLNAAGGQAVPMPAEAMGVLETARLLAEVTRGGFDPTFATLADLWRFDGKTPRPSEAAVAARLPAVGYTHLALDPRAGTARLTDPRTRIGLGAIAKGYAVARARDLLRARGIDAFCLKVGGELYCAGEKGPGQPWTVGIQHPRDPKALVASLPIKDAAFTTSGDYERVVTRPDGTRDHHILDPHTGWPARGVQSVTILARDPTEADALSTGVFVLGVKAGLALIEGMPGAEAVIIDAQGTLHTTRGLKGALTLLKED